MLHNCLTPITLHRRNLSKESNTRVKCATTDPLLPALVEGLGLVHAVPVAAKVAAVPVVAEVAVLVAKVAAVAASLVELQGETEGVREEPGEEAQVKGEDGMINAGVPFSKVLPASWEGRKQRNTGSRPPDRDALCCRRGSCWLRLLGSCFLSVTGRRGSWARRPCGPCCPSLVRTWGSLPGWAGVRRRRRRRPPG